MSKIKISVNIPDGESCENCPFKALNLFEDNICTLFDKVALDNMCSILKSQNKCQEYCSNCSYSEVNGPARCKKCKELKDGDEINL
jgi:hypothetical protein